MSLKSAWRAALWLAIGVDLGYTFASHELRWLAFVVLFALLLAASHVFGRGRVTQTAQGEPMVEETTVVLDSKRAQGARALLEQFFRAGPITVKTEGNEADGEPLTLNSITVEPGRERIRLSFNPAGTYNIPYGTRLVFARDYVSTDFMETKRRYERISSQ
jgi:hypothetical protein